MARTHSGQTTLPSDASTFGGEEPEALLLAWLFPRTDGPVLELAATRDGDAVLGRDESCSVVLSGSEVSRRHAAVRVGPVPLLTDLSSRNGTFVNGRRIATAPLARGDVVRVGGWVGVVTTHQAGALGSLSPGLYGGSVLRKALSSAERAAPSDLPIIIEGETGTGKEVTARAIHAWSGRNGPFVAVNCGALPESLAEGELFGYRRGAFTGAERNNPGHFRSAHGGTLLLDEMGDLPLALQTKLLRVLEQREVHPLGESTPTPIDVRILAAVQEPLERAVEAGRFRPDLYARLDGVTVRVPPLRERRAEIPYLFSRVLVEQSGGRPPAVEARLVERLCLHDWPFNVRELRLLVRKLLVLHGGEGALKARHLPARFQREDGPAPVSEEALQSLDAPADVEDLIAALRASGGNVARAAASLGISRQRAYRLMQDRPDLDLGAFRAPGEKP